MAVCRPNCARLAAASLLALGALAGPAVADGSLKDDSQPSPPERGSFFFGYDGVTGANYYIEGFMFALNGDMSRDGWVIRSYASRVDYDLDPGTGRGYQADALLGYRVDRNSWNGGIYAGFDWQNYQLKPDDPTLEVRGTEMGFKVAGDFETSDDLPYYLALDGYYSTAFDSYWVRGRAGWNFNRLAFGPEVIALGNEDFDAQRVGGFATFRFKLLPDRPKLELTLSAGYQFLSDSRSTGVTGGNTGTSGGGEGAYATVILSTTF